MSTTMERDITDPAPAAAPTERVDAVIVGSGFSGLGMAIRMLQSGMDDFVVLERADALGGTWRDNHYPGCCCDVPSHVYSFSFALNPDWTRGFAPQEEIRKYLEATADAFGVRPHIRFGHEVTGAEWDEAERRWLVQTPQGRFSARVLVSGAGAFSDPLIPDLPGLERFRGATFHSADWDHDHDLRGERVAVVGTGASAIQFVPAIQPEVERLHVFQRTPPWVMPRWDHEITRAEHGLLRWVPFAPALVRAALYWSLEVRVVGFRRPGIMRVADRMARWHLRRQVADRELRRELTPRYTMGCKRILISDDYYPSLTRDNVDVVTAGIREVREHSIVDGDGVEREVDTIVFGTGFRVIDQPIAARLRGRDGRVLADQWARDGVSAYKGTTVAGFPNLFFLLGPNTGLGHNSMVFMIESQIEYVLDALGRMRRDGVHAVEVRPDAQAAYNAQLQRDLEGTVWTASHCKSWYLDDTGRNRTLWPHFSYEFRRRLRRFDPSAYAAAR
jgi:cation diffusion facilitator CzcD-associated flavoprotein CzcO